MFGLELSPDYWWLIAGAVFLAVEAFGIPGIGFLFAGIASIIVGILVYAGIIAADDSFIQLATFFGITAASVAILWKKIKSWRTSPATAGDYNNIVGDTAIVAAGGLAKGKSGKATWSGTTMVAQLSADASVTHIDEGEEVSITQIKGNKLIVAPITTSK